MVTPSLKQDEAVSLWVASLIDYLARRSKSWVMFLSLALVASVALLGLKSGGLSLVLFYIIPIALVTWHSGPAGGNWVAMLSTLCSVGVDISVGTQPDRSILYWNAVLRFVFFEVVILILASLRTTLGWARTDYLTGISNRRGFRDLANFELRRSKRYHRPTTLLYLDVDNFKSINDHMGHNTGDSLLSTVAETLQRSVRSSDLVSRQGGDEFAVLLPETDSAGSKAFAEGIRERLLEAMHQNKWPVSFSIGVVTSADSGVPIEDLLKRADELMYRAKVTGNSEEFARSSTTSSLDISA